MPSKISVGGNIFKKKSFKKISEISPDSEDLIDFK